MADWVGWLLRTIYFYGHFICVSNFEIDWNAGRVFKSRRSTLYPLSLSFLIVILLVVDLSGRTKYNVVFVKSNLLQEYVVVAILGLRITAGVATLHNRWRQRNQMMQLVRSMIRLYAARPQVKRMIRWSVLFKVILCFITVISQVAILLGPAGRVAPRQVLRMFLQFFVSAITSLSIGQYIIVILFVRANYMLLNTELGKVIAESKELSYHSPRNGAFMTRCCHLADQLDNIARLQSELQFLMDRLGEVFGIQGLIVYVEYYITSVAANYLAYSIVRHGYGKLGMNFRSMILAFSWGLFYYLDALFNSIIILRTHDDHQQMVSLLEERTLFAPGLDVRLEESFENIQIQLIRNPFKMRIMNLFSVDRSSTTALAVSIFTNWIYLIQYEMENFKENSLK
ncbi:hypothetical protein KR009_002757 [Drosophila setifemur]|nr:hypothetical protein KR009_002757 [Drosophila setifemur]